MLGAVGRCIFGVLVVAKVLARGKAAWTVLPRMAAGKFTAFDFMAMGYSHLASPAGQLVTAVEIKMRLVWISYDSRGDLEP